MVVNCSSTTNTTFRYPRWEWRDLQTFLAQVFRPIPCINYVHNLDYKVIVRGFTFFYLSLNLCTIFEKNPDMFTLSKT